ncbi:hypothetical protein AB0H28_28775 [Micromonospora sp. NPDC050980]|uniref:hypothetical protein n=1 Tax=Micromonospora sp. NPDC050980 TaxID=3155161 RepID=UPI0033F3E294
MGLDQHWVTTPMLEELVAIGQRRSVSEILRQITQVGDERQTWDLGPAIREFGEPTDRNPLLQQAFDRLPFNHAQPDQVVELSSLQARGLGDAWCHGRSRTVARPSLGRSDCSLAHPVEHELRQVRAPPGEDRGIRVAA